MFSTKHITIILVTGAILAVTFEIFMGGMASKVFGPPVVMGSEDIMSPKAHGTCAIPPQKPLKWNVDYGMADNICCFNRHYAEPSGYFTGVPSFMAELKGTGEVQFFDSVSGVHLFTAPVGRTVDQFISESRAHGWPSFRDAEVDWKNVRVLPGGETVSIDGTHLGHNLPDSKGNRYCINLVCIAGSPKA